MVYQIITDLLGKVGHQAFLWSKQRHKIVQEMIQSNSQETQDMFLLLNLGQFLLRLWLKSDNDDIIRIWGVIINVILVGKFQRWWVLKEMLIKKCQNLTFKVNFQRTIRIFLRFKIFFLILLQFMPFFAEIIAEIR